MTTGRVVVGYACRRLADRGKYESARLTGQDPEDDQER